MLVFNNNVIGEENPIRKSDNDNNALPGRGTCAEIDDL